MEKAKELENEKKLQQSKMDQEKFQKPKVKKPENKVKQPNILPLHLNEIPDRCKKFFKVGDLLYKVPGNGNCGPACGSAHLVGDETIGTYLRRAMNCEIITERDYYKNKGYWCDESNPFEREVRDREPIRFTEPKEMYEFLASPESDFMYSDSEDFLILANMFGIKIKIVRDVVNPREDIVVPDPSMKHCRVAPEFVKIPDMNILFQNGNHFNLVVSADSDLAKYGNRRKLSKVNADFEFIDNFLNRLTEKDVVLDSDKDVEEVISLIDKVEDEPETLKKLIKQLEDGQMKMFKNQESMTNEMKEMRVEIERLRLENKTLKENEKLKVQSQTTLKAAPPEKNNLNCPICGVFCVSGNHFRTHMKSHSEAKLTCNVCNKEFQYKKDLNTHKEDDHGSRHVNDVEYFKCMDCSFQDPDKQVFMNHRKKHISNVEPTSNTQKPSNPELPRATNLAQNNFVQKRKLTCRSCGEGFNEKRLLINHRRDHHPLDRKPCRYDLEDNCSFAAEECWYRHDSNRPQTESRTTRIINKEGGAGRNSTTYNCHSCNEEFRTKNSVMMHRKRIHPEMCKPCEKGGECSRNEECWYTHDNVNIRTSIGQDFHQNSPAQVSP